MARTFFVTFFIILNLLNTISADSCTAIEGLEGCACMMKQGNKSLPISLQDLVGNNTNGKPIRFQTDAHLGWAYAYHPCGTFNMYLNLPNPNKGDYGCKESSVGRFTKNQGAKQCEGFGDLSDAEFAYNKNFTYPVVSDLTLTFTNKSDNHAARISLVCGETRGVKDTQFQYVNVTEGPIQYYYFSLTGPCSCPGGCKLTQPKPSSAMGLLPNISFIVTLSILIGFFKC